MFGVVMKEQKKPKELPHEFVRWNPFNFTLITISCANVVLYFGTGKLSLFNFPLCFCSSPSFYCTILSVRHKKETVLVGQSLERKFNQTNVCSQ